MQISSILDIVDGKLQNSPSISFVYSFKTQASKVKEGDLFIAKNISDVELAVKNGAFAIITENNHPIIDNEIAWIKVESTKLCLIQLVRFKLANFNLEAYFCDKVSYDLINIFASISNKNIRFISNKMEDFILELDNLEDNDVLISQNKSILEKIYPNNKDFSIYQSEVENLIEHSLFEVSFSSNNIYFPKLKISSLYVSQFTSIVNFFEEELDLTKLKSFNHLKPLFLDKTYNLTEFGKSEKFIISQNEDSLINDEIKYIRGIYKYAKTIFITSKYMTNLNDEQIILEKLEDLKTTLKSNSFNAVYIIGFEYNDIYNSLLKLEEENTLF